MKAHRVFAVFAAALWLAAPPAALAVGSLADVAIYDRQANQVLSVYPGRDGSYVAGTPGNEYAIQIRNRSGSDLLAVVSVDGVNVVTGQTANPQQSGYVIPAYGLIEIKGWRKSLQRIAAFYFTDLNDAYAARNGRPDDVGVIGVALFKRKPQPGLELEQRMGRRDQPAPGAADGAGAPRSEAQSAKPEAPAPSLGTGHGRGESSHARYVDFEREASTANEIVTLRYDSRENLVALGVIPERRRKPHPFPGTFVPDPG